MAGYGQSTLSTWPQLVEVKGSHAAWVSQPEAIVELIAKAAKSLSMK